MVTERFEKIVALSVEDLRSESSDGSAPRRLRCICDGWILSDMGPNETWGYERDCPSHGHLKPC